MCFFSRKKKVIQLTPTAAVSSVVEESKAKKLWMQYRIQAEGFKNIVYTDVAGYLTIGIGHKLTHEELKLGYIVIGGERVVWSTKLSNQQVYKLADQDDVIIEKAIRDLVKVALTPGQEAALMSFVYNVGVGAFKSSTLLKLVNKQAYSEVPEQFLRWVNVTDSKTGKKVFSKGLLNRRLKDIELWRTVI